MAFGTLAPDGRRQYCDANGQPLAGGKLYTYVTGTTTALTAYQNSALTTAHTNPIILDGAGRATIYLSAASYKFVLKDADDVTVWTVDPVTALAPYSLNLDISDCTAGEDLAAGDTVFLSGGTGGTVPGRWYKTDATIEARSSSAAMIGMVPTAIAQGADGIIRIQGRMTALTGLSTGAVYYCSETAGAITASAPANERLVGVADSETTLVLFSAAVGNMLLVSGIGFTPIESVGTSGEIIATINASAEGGGTLRISANKLQITGDVTFAAGYDPTTKVKDDASNAPASILNSSVSIAANGTLSGAGGGQVTAVGVGAVKTDASNAPATILNGSITINANGTLAGAGSGQVTISGLGGIATAGAAADINANVTTISGGKITTGSITATQIQASTITGGLIAAGTIVGGLIAAGTITSDKLSVSTLSAITANLGTVTAGTISGVTITAGSSSQVTLNSNGITITPYTTQDFQGANAYRFGGSGGSDCGMAAAEASSTRALYIYNTPTTAGWSGRLHLRTENASGGEICDLSFYSTTTFGHAALYANDQVEISAGSLSYPTGYVLRVTQSAITANAAIVPLTSEALDFGSATQKWKTPYFTLAAMSSGYVACVTDSTGALGYVGGFTGSHNGATYLGGICVSVP